MAQRYKQNGLVDFNQAILAKVLLHRQLPGTLIGGSFLAFVALLFCRLVARLGAAFSLL